MVVNNLSKTTVINVINWVLLISIIVMINLLISIIVMINLLWTKLMHRSLWLQKLFKLKFKCFFLMWTIFIYLFFIYLSIYLWLHWVFIAVYGLSLAAASGCYSLLWCAGFSLRWLLLLWSTGSRHAGFSSCGSRALERRLSSCGARA